MLGPKANQKSNMFTTSKGFTFKTPAPAGPSGVRVEHRIGVQAPAEVIWDILYDVDHWGEWNPLYVKAAGQIRIGSQLDLTMVLGEGQPSEIHPVILEWVPNDQIHWRLKTMGGLVSTTRFLEIEVLDTASCIFSNGEIFGGLLGPTVAKRAGRKIYRAFAAMDEALKERAEAVWRAQGGAPTSAA